MFFWTITKHKAYIISILSVGTIVKKYKNIVQESIYSNCSINVALSKSATPLQVLTPAQCHPMGRSRGHHGNRVHLWQEWGGEPTEREPQGACPLSHPGVCCEHRGGGGLHTVLHQWYGRLVSNTTKAMLYMCTHIVETHRHTNPLTLCLPRPGCYWVQIE